MRAVVAFVGSLFLSSFLASFYGQFTEEHLRASENVEKAHLYLTTEVCSDPKVHAKLESFNKCFDARLALSASPFEVALRKTIERAPLVIATSYPLTLLFKSFLAAAVLAFGSAVVDTLLARRAAAAAASSAAVATAAAEGGGKKHV